MMEEQLKIFLCYLQMWLRSYYFIDMVDKDGFNISHIFQVTSIRRYFIPFSQLGERPI